MRQVARPSDQASVHLVRFGDVFPSVLRRLAELDMTFDEPPHPFFIIGVA
jgi:hypothetical protein